MTTLSTGLATSFITFSRPGATGGGATVTDRDGRIKWAGHNLLTNSESFSSWTLARGTVAANNVASPDGSTTADKFTEDSTSNTRSVSTGATVDSGVRYTFGAFLKNGDRRYVSLSVVDSATGNNYFLATFDLTAGTFTTQNGGTGTAPTATMTALASGWYYCTVSGLAPASVLLTLITPATTATPTISTYGREAYSGDGLKNFYLWGAHLYRSDMQMQQNPAMGAGMGSYYPTTPRNLLGYTEDFSNAAWVKDRSSITANVVLSPNGLQTADFLKEDSTATATHDCYVAISSGASTYTLSVYAKAGTKQFVNLSFGSASSNYIAASFNVATGAVTSSTGAGTATLVGSSITLISDGWYRCSVTGTLAASLTNAFISLLSSGTPTRTTWGREAYTGDGISGFYIWGAQLSDSASLDTYVPQYGAAVTSAAYYAPRLDFDGATLSPKGLLVEEQRVNLLTHTAAFDNADWGKNGTASITADTTVAPDGSTTADTLTGASGDPTVGVTDTLYRSPAVSSSTAYTASLYVRGLTGTTVKLLLRDGSTGTVASTTATLTSSWQRISCTLTSGASTTGFSLRIGGTNGTVAIWGAQLEAGSFATSYIPNGSAVAGATRTADVASVSTQAFPYSDTSGSYVVAFSPAVVDGNLIPISLTDGTANNRILSSNGVDSHLIVVVGNVFQANIDAGTVTAGAVNKIGAAFAANDFAATIGGGTVGTDTSGSVPIVNRMSIGNYNNASGYLNGHIRQITYLPRRLSNAELQSRTA